MWKAIIAKIPMIDKSTTKAFYMNALGFIDLGQSDYEFYLILAKDNLEIHFFENKKLNPFENDGQLYIRVENIDDLYQELIEKQVVIHPNGKLQNKPWGQREFSILDPNHNLLTFGQSL